MLDIGLTIWAWLRGWKAWALLPIGITYPLVFLLGAVGALDTAALLLLILAEVGALIYMVARPQKKKQQATVSNLGSPVAGEPLSRPEEAERLAKEAEASVRKEAEEAERKAKLILPDNSEISLTEAVRPIGRGDFEKVVSAEALRYISRQHLLIRYDNGKYLIEDLNSANGTKVNGIEIKGKGWQELKDGDRIDIADVAALTFKTGLP